jgi:hypothetical protein
MPTSVSRDKPWSLFTHCAPAEHWCYETELKGDLYRNEIVYADYLSTDGRHVDVTRIYTAVNRCVRRATGATTK